jgi:predicted DsbA family dithiol-disulfide isomerase
MIAEQPLLEAVQAFGAPVDIEWMPFELRPYPTPTLRPEDSYLQTVWPQSVYPVAERFGVELRLPSVSPQPYTALAWQGYQFARVNGLGHPYNDLVLRAFFQDDQDIGRIDVLAQIALRAGLDPVDFEAAVREGRYREAHENALSTARAQGVSAVPAFRIGRRWLPGVQEARVLERAMREVAHLG